LNEIAKFLLSLDSTIDKVMFHKQRLHSSIRLPEETLSAAISKVRNIVDKLHPLPTSILEHVSNSVANRYLINAIISFLRDELAIPLLTRIQQDNASSRLLYYTEYLNMAMDAEVRGQIFPTSPLKYGRKLNFGVNPVMMLNNIEIPNIHPCMNVPIRKNYLPNDLTNYFGRLGNQTEEYTNTVSSFGDGIPHPINPSVIPPQQIGPVPPFSVNPNADSSLPIATIPQPGTYGSRLPVRSSAQCKKFVRRSDIPKNVNLYTSKKFVRRSDIPKNVNLYTSPQGQYIVINKEKVYVEDDMSVEPIESILDQALDTDSKKLEEADQKSDSSSDSSETDNVYDQLKLMSIALQKALSLGSNKRGNSQEKRNSNVRPDSPFRQGNPNNSNKSDYGQRSSSKEGNQVRTNSQNRNNSYRGNSRDRQYSRGNSLGRNSNYQNTGNTQNERGRSDYRNYQGQHQSDNRSNSQSNRADYGSSGRQTDSNHVRSNSGNRQMQGQTNSQKSDYQTRGRSPSPYSCDRRDISRDRSLEYKRAEQRAYNSYPKMKKGYKCSPGYNPILNKRCSKCSNTNTHHEFECRVYEEWNENICSLCEKYHHFSKSCKEISRFPPKNADSNSINVN
jgi:hypothetical protein